MWVSVACHLHTDSFCCYCCCFDCCCNILYIYIIFFTSDVKSLDLCNLRCLNRPHLQEINLLYIRNPFMEMVRVSFNQLDAVKYHQDLFLLSDIMNGVISFSFYFGNLSKINQACFTKPKLLSLTFDIFIACALEGWFGIG